MAVLESETKPIRLDLPAAVHRELRKEPRRTRRR